MTDTTKADASAADLDKAKADAAADASKTTATTAADIMDICVAAGVPTMASALIREGATVEQARARTDSAKDIRAAVDIARKACPKIEANAADAFIAAGMPLDQVRAKLFEQITAAQSPEITGSHQSTTAQDEAAVAAAAIVATYRGTMGNKQRSA